MNIRRKKEQGEYRKIDVDCDTFQRRYLTAGCLAIVGNNPGIYNTDKRDEYRKYEKELCI